MNKSCVDFESSLESTITGVHEVKKKHGSESLSMSIIDVQQVKKKSQFAGVGHWCTTGKQIKF